MITHLGGKIIRQALKVGFQKEKSKKTQTNRGRERSEGGVDLTRKRRGTGEEDQV